MNRYHFYSNSNWKMTLVLLLGVILMFDGCIEPLDSSSDRCLNVPLAEATGIKRVYFGPFKNQQARPQEDTVNVKEFSFNLELDIEVNGNTEPDPFFSNPEGISCLGIYSIRNIATITVVLLEPFSGIPAGMDISYLLKTSEGKSINELRDFDRVSVYLGTQLNFQPENYSQLKTRTFLFLRDGSIIFRDSTSPYLKTS
ncbi:hypothetical protein [Algoriphagus sanaruensis]|uniref:Uncharacterized protein n=1 Tax=Algoriphagus sanaruensis TaxID=1727163 RepID=A0A142ENH4_9BACT|nr:hypothetical protein [Algoriphagus sanaruensis]AMQ56679.1 hypothetical protein AO498_09620 [Algoriphagus sanaruensis]